MGQGLVPYPPSLNQYRGMGTKVPDAVGRLPRLGALPSLLIGTAMKRKQDVM